MNPTFNRGAFNDAAGLTAGECVICGAELALNHKSLCDRHRVERASDNKARRDKLKAEHKCWCCTSALPEGWVKVKCQRCLDKANVSNKRNRKAQKKT